MKSTASRAPLERMAIGQCYKAGGNFFDFDYRPSNVVPFCSMREKVRGLLF